MVKTNHSFVGDLEVSRSETQGIFFWADLKPQAASLQGVDLCTCLFKLLVFPHFRTFDIAESQIVA